MPTPRAEVMAVMIVVMAVVMGLVVLGAWCAVVVCLLVVLLSRSLRMAVCWLQLPGSLDVAVLHVQHLRHKAGRRKCGVHVGKVWNHWVKKCGHTTCVP